MLYLTMYCSIFLISIHIIGFIYERIEEKSFKSSFKNKIHDTTLHKNVIQLRRSK